MGRLLVTLFIFLLSVLAETIFVILLHIVAFLLSFEVNHAYPITATAL